MAFCGALTGDVHIRCHQPQENALGKPSADAGAVGTDLLLITRTLSAIQVLTAYDPQKSDLLLLGLELRYVTRRPISSLARLLSSSSCAGCLVP